MADNSSFDPWHLANALWAALGSIVIWNGKKMDRRLDTLEEGKADEDSVEERHKENISTLSQIMEQLNGLKKDLQLQRTELNGTIQRIALDVNTLMERSRAALSREDREAAAREENGGPKK